MARKRAAPPLVGQRGARPSLVKRDDESIPHDEWERGTRWAAIALMAMFAFLSLGATLWNW